jgi:hypothetical protein
MFEGEYMLVSGICTEATANLIAAAPDLAETLREIVANVGPHDCEKAHWCADEARAALAKAHGQ